MRLCPAPELLVTPTPLIVNVTGALAETANEFAPGSKTISLTSVSLDIETTLWLLVSNMATSFGPLGTIIGDQFAALFQSPDSGFANHVALVAKAGSTIRKTPRQNIATTKNEKMEMRIFGPFVRARDYSDPRGQINPFSAVLVRFGCQLVLDFGQRQTIYHVAFC
jgi:hypothetical protein